MADRDTVMARLEVRELTDIADRVDMAMLDDADRTTTPISENGLLTQVMSHDWSFPVARNRTSKNYPVETNLPVDSSERCLATERFDVNRDRLRFWLN